MSEASPAVVAFVQARMSSRRFPGKVLAPFRGEPIIRHVIRSVTEALPSVPLVVTTSVDTSDDPLAAYLSGLEVTVFRGALLDVFRRFRDCLTEFPCEWILRISGDSPLLDPRILKAVVARGLQEKNVDLVTTIFPRTFPSGQNAELIRSDALRAVDPNALTAGEREHVTPWFYRHPERFRIVNVSSGSPELAARSFAVDTPEDLERLEASAHADLQSLVAAIRL
jgi:spore coat polysaccharide biosynthesis protein SpsF